MDSLSNKAYTIFNSIPRSFLMGSTPTTFTGMSTNKDTQNYTTTTQSQTKSALLMCPNCTFVFKIWETMTHSYYGSAVCKHGCSPSVQLASDIPRSVNSLSVNIAGGLRFPLPMGSNLKKSQLTTSSWPSSWTSNAYIKKRLPFRSEKRTNN